MQRPRPLSLLLPIRIVLSAFLFMQLGAHAQGDVKNGQYLAKAAGCVGCHTHAKAGSVPFAGGRALETPFGTFFGPNITPDRETGLGAWTEADFNKALKQGTRPDGAHYFPAFPYASFTGMSDNDVRDLWSYLRSLPPTKQANQAHDLRFPFGLRPLVGFWKWLYLPKTPFQLPVQANAELARGAYLVRVLGHCGECHTPRNFLGGPKADQLLAGAKLAEGKAPNLTPARLKKWNDADLKSYLMTGMTPESDIASAAMNEVIVNTTSQLTAADMAALIAYLRSVPTVPEEK
jgi:mono/diheme cytochrome c family protein